MPKLAANSLIEFYERFSEALRVRLHPNTNLHLKQLAAGIGRSEHTISRWWRGESRPLAEDVDRLSVFFARRGDREFLSAVFGRLMPQPDAVSDEKVMDFLRRLLAGEAGKRASSDLNFWFTEEGSIAAAPLGLGQYVGRALGMPGSGDLTRYAVSILGWIAVTVQTDGVIVIRHDARRVAPPSAERVCEWLRAQQEVPPLVKRVIHIESRWFKAYHDTLELAALALEKVSLIVRTPRRRWKVNQLLLEQAKHPRLLKLLALHRKAPDQIMHAAADIGAFTFSSVFSVNGEEVVSHHVGTEFSDLDPRLNEGKNVLTRADTDYAVMVWARIIAAKTAGASFHELAGSVNNYHVHYLNLALAEPGAHGRVLSSTVILDMEPIAA